MQLERINAALRYLKRPRVDHFPLQLSQLGDLLKYPVWAANSKGTLLKNLDEPILFNPAFKLPTLQQLNLLYHHTIYESDSSFAIVDFAVQLDKTEACTELTEVLEWLKAKASLSADEIEAHSHKLLTKSSLPHSPEYELIAKYRERQSDPDVLALRVMETTLLLKLAYYTYLYAQSQQEDATFSTSFTVPEDELVELSEAIGLLRALQPSPDGETTLMDIDLDEELANISTSSMACNISSSSFSLPPVQSRPPKTEFERYLLEKFTRLASIKHIIELIAERCGFPFDSEDEDELDQRDRDQSIFSAASSEKPSKTASPIHWRRVKPVTLQSKSVPSSRVKTSSRLASANKLTTKIASLGKQVELPAAPMIAPNSSSRRSSVPSITEGTASNALTTTPTKQTKPESDVIILETPPRRLQASAKRLFPQNPNNPQ